MLSVLIISVAMTSSALGKSLYHFKALEAWISNEETILYKGKEKTAWSLKEEGFLVIYGLNEETVVLFNEEDIISKELNEEELTHNNLNEEEIVLKSGHAAHWSEEEDTIVPRRVSKSSRKAVVYNKTPKTTVKEIKDDIQEFMDFLLNSYNLAPKKPTHAKKIVSNNDSEWYNTANPFF